MIKPTKDIENLLDEFFSGDPTPQVIESIEAWLRADPAHPLVLAEYGLIDRLIVREQKSADASAVYTLLAQSQAPDTTDQPEWLALYEQNAIARRAESINKNNISTRQAFSLAGYVLSRALTSKPAYKAYAIAAVLLIAATLFFVFDDEGDDTATDPLAEQVPALGSQLDPSNGSVPSVVATLTAERDAVWDRRPGDHLYVGQRFTLTKGFAEITTNHGAIAILEAPAIIELLDNENAIRLHAGKLVGFCETPLSKGFTVVTPNSHVVDIGTQFGVEVTESSITTIQVYKGVVQVAPIMVDQPTGHTVSVYEQQAVESRPNSNLSVVAFDQKRFRVDQGVVASPSMISVGDTLLVDFGWKKQGFETVDGHYNNLSGDPDETIVTVGTSPHVLFSDLIRSSDGADTGVSLSVQSYSGKPGRKMAFGLNANRNASRSIAGFPETVLRDTVYLNNSSDADIRTAAVLRFSGLDDSLSYKLTLASFIDDKSSRPESIFSASGKRDSYNPSQGGAAELKGLKTDGRGNLEVVWTMSNETFGAGQLDGLRLEALRD